MGDDEDDPGPSAKEVLLDAEGNVRWRLAVDAIRGRRSDETDLGPLLVVTLVVILLGTPVWGVVAGEPLVEVLETAGWWLFAYVVFLFLMVTSRVEDHFTDDEDVAVETLRSRYVAGEVGFEEFQRRLDLVYEEGAETVWGDDEAAAPNEGDAGDRDPVAILRERFARGEVDEEEFRRRMEMLGEPVEETTTDDATPERILDRER